MEVTMSTVTSEVPAPPSSAPAKDPSPARPRKKRMLVIVNPYATTVSERLKNLVALADDFRPRKVDLGVASGRRFVFACGCGLDATAAQRVDSHPKLKARGGRWFYTYAVVAGFYRRYLRNPTVMRLAAADETAE